MADNARSSDFYGLSGVHESWTRQEAKRLKEHLLAHCLAACRHNAATGCIFFKLFFQRTGLFSRSVGFDSESFTATADVTLFVCFSGLQEYVEAVSFQHFIKTRSLISMEEINKQLTFTTEDSGKESKTPSSEGQDKQLVTWRLNVTPVDYLLGVADLTGELMRMCINSVGNGDIDTPFEVSQFLRQVYDGFSFIGNTGPYEVSKKLYTLKQSLAKVENACYALRVRGSEIPKHMLADVFSVKTEIIDQEESIS
ncbi:translin-associated protein X [Acomys russatus]|uniref:translin-associated protein X n=1 Tax=Acomys russatus TaxID=60746 RepID=UPI0021E264E1|nr:translin-associated protein X [Acomys russatus]